jgi:hypothetical protein
MNKKLKTRTWTHDVVSVVDCARNPRQNYGLYLQVRNESAVAPVGDTPMD